jgi:hypothetical protein
VRIIVACTLALILAGCVGDSITKGMGSLVGQPLDAAIAKLGVPTSESTIAGRKVYVWVTQNFVEGTAYRCQIRVVMKGDVTGSFDWDGNNAGCLRYAAILGP